MSELPRALGANLVLPVIAAPMFLVSGPELVTAACQAGIIGSFPATNARSIGTLEAWLRTITWTLNSNQSGGTHAAWSVSLVTHQSYTRLAEELDLVCRYKAPLVTTALGSPRSVIDAVHAYGGFVYADVSSVSFAKRAADSGVDGLILVCAGAGGHTGKLSPFAFVPAVREFWKGPIVVGGAISDGRTVHALQVLGADLAYMGTRFITSTQSMVTDRYRQMVVHSDSEDILATSAFTGVVANMLIPSIRRSGLDPDNLLPGTTINFEDPHDTKNIKPWKDIWSAGQGVGSIHEIESVADTVRRIRHEYNSSIAECCNRSNSESTPNIESS